MIRRVRNLFILFVFVTIALAGCAKDHVSRNLPTARGKLPADAVRKLEDAEKVSTVRALAVLEVNYNSVKRKYDVVIAAKVPNSIRLEFVDPLAGPVVTIIFTRDQLVYADSKGVYDYKGEDAISKFSEIVKLPWTPVEAASIFMGRLPVAFSPSDEYPVRADGEFFIAENGGLKPDENGALEYLAYNGGKLRAKINYNDYEKKGSIFFPTTIGIELKKPKTKVTLTYKNVLINSKINDKLFSELDFQHD